MKRLLTVLLVVCIGGAAVQAAEPWLIVGGELLGGTLGGAVGAVGAIALVGAVGPHLESATAKTALVLSSITLGCGLGGGAGVLASTALMGVEGNTAGALLGGLIGGVLAALTQPIVHSLGISENVAEFLEFAAMPIIPAIAATIGFGWARSD